MKAYDLKPTSENLLDTYLKDIIERNPDIFRFTEILDAIEDSCVIALDGNWGSGKTFFVKQVKMVMDAHNAFIDRADDENVKVITSVRNNYYKNNIFDLQPQVCVYYDAWANDNDDDPILSLVYAILNNIDSDFSFKERNFIKIGASILEMFSGWNWTQLIERLRGSSTLEGIKDRKNLEDLVNKFLDSLIPEKGNRLIVFIDELDRCKPSYAVRLLERIKHYFSNDKITFVFSVNTNELQHTIKKYYGNDFDSSRYLDRFFDLRMSLSAPNLKNFYRSLNFDEGRYIFDVVCDEVIKTYHFELREIAKFLRLAKIAAHKPTHGGTDFSFPDGRGTQFCLHFVVPIMIGLKIHNIQRYFNFVNGKDHSPLIEIGTLVNIRIFEELLDRDETFDGDDSGATQVSLNEKLKAVYDAIFVTSYTGTFYHTMIGNLEFNEQSKEILMRTVNLLSRFTELTKEDLDNG